MITKMGTTTQTQAITTYVQFRAEKLGYSDNDNSIGYTFSCGNQLTNYGYKTTYSSSTSTSCPLSISGNKIQIPKPSGYNEAAIYVNQASTSIYLCYASMSGYKTFIYDSTDTTSGVELSPNIIDSSRETTCSGSCTPSCSGKQCGDDGCGGSCGTCSSGYTCTNNQCITPTTTTTLPCSCVDSDGGNNIYVGGQVNYCGQIISDSCVSGMITEIICGVAGTPDIRPTTQCPSGYICNFAGTACAQSTTTTTLPQQCTIPDDSPPCNCINDAEIPKLRIRWINQNGVYDNQIPRIRLNWINQGCSII